MLSRIWKLIKNLVRSEKVDNFQQYESKQGIHNKAIVYTGIAVALSSIASLLLVASDIIKENQTLRGVLILFGILITCILIILAFKLLAFLDFYESNKP